MRYYIIAGEASGDLHASNLIKEIKKLDANAVIKGIGGDKMRAEGMELLVHYRDIAFMGLSDVLMNINTIRKAMRQCEKDILQFKPDAVILVDYPGFNMRMARFVKEHNIKTIYYISPKLWAWNSARAKQVKKYVDLMLCILPFEKEFYKKFDYEVKYVGNPVPDEIAQFNYNKNFIGENKLGEKPIIALLPGSRKQEIEKCLPVMLSIVNDFPAYQFVIAGMTNTKQWLAQQDIPKEVKIVFDSTYDLLKNSTAALVTSGTATLETALFNVPQICCYKASGLTYSIAKRLVNVSHISLVNLILGETCITELIQNDFNPERLKNEIELILPAAKKREIMIGEYEQLRNILGGSGASAKAAQYINIEVNSKLPTSNLPA